jgi:hypothetical protein
VKQFAFIRAPAPLVQLFRHFRIGVLIEQVIHERNNLLR